MKNTQIEWIGNIPDDWDVKPISTCFKERNEKVSDYEWEPLSVTKQGIVKQLETAAKSDAHDARKKVCKNDFVINSRSDRKQSCGVSPYDGSVSLINIVLENRKLNPKFVNYLLKNYGFAEEFYRYGSGIVADLWSTNYQKMKKIMIPIPPKEKQQKIAVFLDKKILEIDNIIEKTKETIKDYKKYKKSIITQSVTKGLNENVNMKKTSIEWIDSIPQHWDDMRLKNKLYVRARLGWKGLKADEYVEEGYPLLSAFNIVNSKLDFSDVNYINKFRYDESPEIKLTVNDILLVKDGAGIGKCAIVEKLPQECTVNGSIALLTCDNGLNSKYLYYYFLSEIFQQYIDRLKDGMGVPHLFQRDIKMIYLAVPPKEEQDNIVKYLDKKCNEIDKLIINKEKIIEELEQYKKSLIYEYVTGKKEVEANNSLMQDNSKEIKVKCKDNIFAQAILLCKIIEKLNEYNLGRVKAEKTLYLIEKDVGFNFENNYVREAAGPLSEAIYKCESVISKKNKWIKINKVNKHIEYEILSDFNKYNKYYEKYYLNYDNQIENIINIIKEYSTDKAEMIATLYASWNDFIIKKEEISDLKIVKDVRENWNDTKKRFDEDKWLAILEEMKQIGLKPKGNGNLTIVKEQ